MTGGCRDVPLQNFWGGPPPPAPPSLRPPPQPPQPKSRPNFFFSNEKKGPKKISVSGGFFFPVSKCWGAPCRTSLILMRSSSNAKNNAKNKSSRVISPHTQNPYRPAHQFNPILQGFKSATTEQHSVEKGAFRILHFCRTPNFPTFALPKKNMQLPKQHAVCDIMPHYNQWDANKKPIKETRTWRGSIVYPISLSEVSGLEATSSLTWRG